MSGNDNQRHRLRHDKEIPLNAGEIAASMW